jgi:hypothetical protein
MHALIAKTYDTAMREIASRLSQVLTISEDLPTYTETERDHVKGPGPPGLENMEDKRNAEKSDTNYWDSKAGIEVIKHPVIRVGAHGRR